MITLKRSALNFSKRLGNVNLFPPLNNLQR